MTEHRMSDDLVDAAMKAWAETGRYGRVPVRGDSMNPLLRSGDVAVVTHGRVGLHFGRILAYRSGDRLVVHRLLRSQPDGALILAGDNSPRADAPVPLSAVLGQVTAVETRGGSFSLQTPLARALGRMVAAAFPLRRVRALHWVPGRLAALTARLVRR